MTNIDLLKQRLSLLASSGVLSDSAVSTIDEAVKALDEQKTDIYKLSQWAKAGGIDVDALLRKTDN